MRFLRGSTTVMKRLATRARTRRCGFEQLEQRTQLASLILSAQAWTNVGGVPTAAIPASMTAPLAFTVTRGQDFFLQLTAEDRRGSGREFGIVALALKTEWNVDGPNVISSLNSDNDSRLIPPAFANGRNISVNNSINTAIHNGGTINIANAIGNDTCIATPGNYATTICSQFSLFQFRALENGQSRILVNLNGSMAFADSALLESVNGRSQITGVNELEVIIDVVEPAADGSLSGYVFADANLNGVRDRDSSGQPLEMGLPNVTVTLFASGGAASPFTVTTGPDGWYEFSSLPPGSYSIEQIQPAGFISTARSLGTVLPANISSGVASDNLFTGIVLGAGDHAVEYDFGEVMSARSITKRWMLGSSPPVEAQTARLLGIPTRWIAGSTGNDTIAVSRTASTWQVSVNNTPVVVGGEPTARFLVLDASQGFDQVTVDGTPMSSIALDGSVEPAGTTSSSAATPNSSTATAVAAGSSRSGVELAHIQPARYALTRAGVPLNVAGGYAILIIGNDGTRFVANLSSEDRAVFDDSPGTDTVIALNNRIATTYALSSVTSEVFNAGQKRIVSRSGADNLTAASVDGVLEVVGQWL